MKKYREIVKHYEHCLQRHGDTHLGVDWPNFEDAQVRYSVMLDILMRKHPIQETSLLDFGCGTAHLLDYINKEGIDFITYSGLDLSKQFVEVCRSKFPDHQFFSLDIIEKSEPLPEFDYIVCNGVFTEKRTLSFDEMWSYFKQMIVLIFEKAKKGIAFNVMSTMVDWERDDLFHLPTDLLIEFLCDQLSRNIVIRQDYGLYEYTVYVYKN